MLSKKVLNSLLKEPQVSLENQEAYKKILVNNNINVNSDFYEFMFKYGGDIDGTLGYMMNVPEDLSQKEHSVTFSLHKNEGVPDNFISLFDYEYEDYLLYNKNDGSVIMIEGGNMQKLSNNNYDKKWNDFNSFLEDFLP